MQVNGVNIYSDKEVESVKGSIVSFKDGSYCDVSNQTITNIGNGFISFDESDKKKSTLIQKFNGINNCDIQLTPNIKIENSLNKNTNSVINIS